MAPAILVLSKILTLKGSVFSTRPSGQWTAAGSNLTLNSMPTGSGSPGRERTLSPKSTLKPVPSRERWEVVKETGQWPTLVRVRGWETTRPYTT